MPRSKRHRTPIAQASPNSPAAEAYHTIRTNIQFRDTTHGSRVILVTSASRGEGKTATACNLAVTLSQSCQRVLLIDADLRSPEIHNLFHVGNELGLSEILSDEKKTTEYIQIADIPGLYLLTSGPRSTNPSSLLSTNRFERFVANVRCDFDTVIIDSPPVLSASDALVISRLADGTLFVVDALKTNRVVAQKAVAMLRQMNANIIGGVFNRVPKHARKYPIGATLQQNPLAASLNV